MRAPVPITALAVAAVLAGCGASDRRSPAPSGAALFAGACAVCHTVSGVDDPRRQGGDLRDLRASTAQLLQFAREMPVRNRLSSAQLDAIVAYLRRVERG